MAYTKHTWEDGEVITAAKLNNIEDGCDSGGSLTVTATQVNGKLTLNKTAQEIWDAISSGTTVYCFISTGERTDYSAQKILTPVSRVYQYAYGEYIRIAINSCIQPGAISGSSKSYLFKPCVVLFEAGGWNQYPVYYTTIAVGDAYAVETSGY